MAKRLSISDDMDLPLDFVTERIAFLARTGAGKSGGMRVLFEALLDAGQFVIFVDPKGDAWGVRAAGAGAGYPVLVMGGDHGDVPLESTAGKFIAEFLVKERVSTVLDVSDFGKAEMIRFVTDLANTLYRRNRDVVHVFLDEADMIAGEKFYDPHCLEAIQLIQNKGRHRGFGVTVATQRSAMINKTVLYASGTLVAMQTTSPKDIKTVRDWLEVIATKEEAKEIVSALPTLKTREALIYSPQYLGEARRITFKTFRTFDSMRTPKPGEARQQPKSLADIDLSVIERDMAATIEKAKAEDPKLLRKRIAELERAKPEADPKMIERAVNKAVSEAEDRFEALQRENVRAINDLRGRLDKIAQLASLNGNAPALAEYKRVEPHVVVDRPAPRRPVQINPSGSGDLGKCETAILSVLSQFPEGCDSGKLTLLTGYRYSGGFKNSLSALRTQGLIVGGNTEVMRITDEGLARGPFPELPQGEALINYWLNHPSLGVCERAILGQLIEVGERGLTADELCERTGYKYSGGFKNSLSKLRTAGLLAGRNTETMRASDHLV